MELEGIAAAEVPGQAEDPDRVGAEDALVGDVVDGEDLGQRYRVGSSQ